MFIGLFLHSSVFAKISSSDTEQFSQQLQIQLDNTHNKTLKIDQHPIIMSNFIRQFYSRTHYRIVWKSKPMIERLLKAIKDSTYVGLSPKDYDYQTIKKALGTQIKDYHKQRANIDIILTDAFIRLVYHLRFGKVIASEMSQDWNIKREFQYKDPIAKLAQVLRSKKTLDQFLQELTDLGVLYKGLIKGLAFYQKIEKRGGWQNIPQGSVIKPSMQDVRIPLIRKRLEINGYLEQGLTADQNLYDNTLEAAVKKFQYHYNLDVDGIIGKGSLIQMNISVSQRIEQIKANLERVRWVKTSLSDEFVLVNVAGYKVYYVQNNKVVWQSKVQVGKEYRQTPIFQDEIEYIVLNPTWTIPPTILSQDILPKIKKDPFYLKKKNMIVIDAKGKEINSSTIEWSSVTAEHFPYMIRQEPGPKNALGQVKIMFPNKHFVYLHDTPHKELFDKTNRDFSSGCIRVENPFELAQLLLKNTEQWNNTRFKTVLESQQLKNVPLPNKVPVLLLYFTAQLDKNGQINFFEDIYKRDQKIIDGLKEPFRWVIPDKESSNRLY